MNRRMLCLNAIPAAAGFFGMCGASSQSGSESKQRVTYFPNRSPQAAYSSAVLVGDTLYIAGVIGLDQKRGKPPDKIEDEIKNLLDAYTYVLRRADFVMEDLVYVQVYCTDLSYYDKFNAAYRTYFSKQLPARVFVGVKSILAGAHFEMQAIAVRQ
jgi:2-iminobutanoate/2-iminopropanoate deaminase